MVSYGRAWVPAERTNDTIMMKIPMNPVVWDLDRCAEMLAHAIYRWDIYDEELESKKRVKQCLKRAAEYTCYNADAFHYEYSPSDEELHHARTIIDHFFHFTAEEESE
jgi:hypothetical protein